jgi:hypothetical protein
MVDLFMTVSPLLAERDVRLPGGAAASFACSISRIVAYVLKAV